jgi:hypothetical protein
MPIMHNVATNVSIGLDLRRSLELLLIRLQLLQIYIMAQGWSFLNQRLLNLEIGINNGSYTL